MITFQILAWIIFILSTVWLLTVIVTLSTVGKVEDWRGATVLFVGILIWLFFASITIVPALK